MNGMVKCCVGNIIVALNSVPSDESILCDGSSDYSDSDNSDVKILGSKYRRSVEVDESQGSSFNSNSTHSGTVAKSLLEC